MFDQAKIDRRVDAAKTLLAAGFSTKAAKKQALELLSRAYNDLRYQSNVFYDADAPFSLCHWRSKHRAAMLKIDADLTPVVDQVDALFSLRATIDATEVVKAPAKPKFTRTSENSHTHRGTCQYCGRVQAVDNDTGLLANHGYSVEWHQHQGTCLGSKLKPLEVARDYADKTITNCIETSNDLFGDAEMIKKGTLKIEFYRQGTNPTTGKSERIPATREEIGDRVANVQIEVAIGYALREARAYRDHAEMLARLIEERHGQPLHEVVLI
jgi:hypothetical protein